MGQGSVPIDTDAMLADLATLVGFASVGGSAGEVAIQRWCAERLADLGASVDTWEVDLAEAAHQPGFPGMEVERAEALGVVGTWGEGEPLLILCGHTDVVPSGDLAGWSRDPFRLVVEDGTAYGRGACDMLGGLAAELAAIRAVRAAGGSLEGLAVHPVSGEEDGGIGAWSALRRGHSGAACVIGEPTGGDLVVANGGALTFRLEVPGRAAHASTRLDGVSAIEKLRPLVDALAELEHRRNLDPDPVMAHLPLPYALLVATVHAGDWSSTVPDLAVVEGRYGVRLGEDAATAQEQFSRVLEQVCASDDWLREHPVRLSWPGGRFASGRLPAGHPFADEVADAVVATGADRPRAVGAPYGSDLRHYAAAGIPTLQYGPGDIAHAHVVDESVPVADLVRCARTYATLIGARCGRPEAVG